MGNYICNAPSKNNGLKNTKVLYLTKLSIRNKGEFKTFTVKQKLKEFIANRPALQEMLKGILQAEMKGH